MSPSRPHAFHRALTVLIAVLGVTLGLTAHAGVAQAADDCSGLSCLTFTSVNSGLNLDVQNGNTGDGVFIVTNAAPGYHQMWEARLQGSDSSFIIVNGATGKCIETGVPLRQQPCSGASAQRW
jgi:hypothetical protein